MCEVAKASWLPAAVAGTLRAARSPDALVAWLRSLRETAEEYDPLVLVRPPSPSPEPSDESTASPDSAFDEILSQLGKEIFKLDEYQNKFDGVEKEVSLSILNIFDECLEEMSDSETIKLRDQKQAGDVVNRAEECSECGSTVSEVSFLTSTPAKRVGAIFEAGMATPVPPPRTRLKTPSTSSSIYDNVELRQVSLDEDSDSESTCWSYTRGEGGGDARHYAKIWSHSTGYHNSDDILRKILLQNHATVSRVSYDTASELTQPEYPVYSLQEVGVAGDRCVSPASSVADMTPGEPADDGYEPVRDAITTENIYEEIEYGNSYTDEGFSCGGSVEVESCSLSASSEGVGRDSPLYANLMDHDAYAIPQDVIFWKNLLLDPLYNDDEEDEWITPEECAVYTREQRPPLVIPRITQHRAPARVRPLPYPEENLHEASIAKSRYDRIHDWSPTSERGAPTLDHTYKSTDSPPLPRLNKRFGGSTENLLSVSRRPNHLHLPASSSGDSLDIEVREPQSYGRNRKSRSMVATKRPIRVKSPVPAPRLINQPLTLESTVILEGPIKRTKFAESGKKSKKNWTECYMILTSTALIFFKDQKTYYATKLPKPAGTPPSPSAPRAELVLPLRNSHIVHCIQMHTRRFTRSLVLTVGYDQYLLQDDTEDGAKRWLLCIRNAIYKLSPPNLDDYPTQHYQSSSTDLESMGRTPPATRHNRNKNKAGGSSNEDLSDSTEVSIQKTQVKSRLRKFFQKRPSMEVLVKKGIYKDEPVFGRNLDEVCPAAAPRVPEFVVQCVREIESSEENMCTDGLYRASGNLSQVQKIRLEIDQNNSSVIENNADIHVLTGSLKLFFRELKQPLIPCNMFDRVLAACSIKPREAKIKEFRDIVQALPPCNRDTLKFLLEHLLRVTQYSEKNRMHTANLAIVFGPTLLWAPAEQAHNIAIDCIQQNNVVDTLLAEYKDIFGDDKAKRKT